MATFLLDLRVLEQMIERLLTNSPNCSVSHSTPGRELVFETNVRRAEILANLAEYGRVGLDLALNEAAQESSSNHGEVVARWLIAPRNDPITRSN